MTEGLSPRAQRVAALLRNHRTRTVKLDDLWRILQEADPSLGLSAGRREILRDVLDELAAHGLLRVSRSLDPVGRPPLPTHVTVPAQARPVARRVDVVWHPALRWVPDAAPTPGQRDDLRAVNQWLHDRPRPAPAPLRERSLEIFGDEKRLDRLIGSQLFAEGRLTLGLLATYRVRVRFTSEPVGDGDLLLVAENSDTFDSLVRVLRDRADHRVGRVARGAGGAFEASVLSVAQLDPPVTGVAYFGDLDDQGLRIPANAAEITAREGLPAVRPAVGLYGALLARTRPAKAARAVAEATAADLVAWLDPAHRDAVRDLLLSGQRAAQEAVGVEYLTTADDWLVDLR